MSDVEAIKNIAEEYEMPVEQVALIWSVLAWVESFQNIDVAMCVEEFIENKLN